MPGFTPAFIVYDDVFLSQKIKLIIIVPWIYRTESYSHAETPSQLCQIWSVSECDPKCPGEQRFQDELQCLSLQTFEIYRRSR